MDRVNENVVCPKCSLLVELLESAEKTDRNYWIATEIFCWLHNGDICNYEEGVKSE